MYTIVYGKYFHLRKMRWIWFKSFFIVLKLFFLFIFWSFWLIFILLLLILFYKFIKQYRDNILLWYSYNGYLNYIQRFKENKINQEEEVYALYFLDEVTSEEEEKDFKKTKAKSTAYFIDNPNYEEIELIDDFYQIVIHIADVNNNVLFSNNLDANNNLIHDYVFYQNDDKTIKYNLKELDE